MAGGVAPLKGTTRQGIRYHGHRLIRLGRPGRGRRGFGRRYRLQDGQAELVPIVPDAQELAKLLGCDVDVVRYRDIMNPRLKARIESEALYV